MEKSEINQSLLAHLRALPGYEQLISDLETGQFAQASRFGLGLPRSARLALLAAIHEDLNHPILLLTNRADRALSLFDEIGFWLPDSKLFYYPEPNPLFYEPLSWSVSTRRERIQVLSELARFHLPGVQTKQTAPVLVAPIRAIMTKTLPRRDFLRQTKKITKGQTIAFEGLLRQWIGIGYESSNIVVQTGQISRRGGILDIWSPGSDLPVRIEFFGDEIETLRSFNPATQLTVQPLEQVVIYPAREILTLDAEKKGFLAEGLEEHQLAEVYSFPASLIDYLPEQSIIMLDGEEFIAVAVNDIEEESIARRTELIQEGNLNPDAAVPYITWSEIEDGFHDRQVLELGYTNAPDNPGLASAIDPAPRFAGRLKDFTAHLHAIHRKGVSWSVVSRQASRLRELWKESHPLEDFDFLDQVFIEGSLSGGWILNKPGQTQHQLLTDSEVFGWGRPQPRRKFQRVAESPEAFYGDLEPGNWVVHVDHGIGKFVGLIKPVLDNIEREYLCIEYKDNDLLYVPIHQADRITKYIGGEGGAPSFSRLGGSEWQLTKQKVRHAVQEVATDLLELYAKRQLADGYAFSPDTAWQKELEASFPYIETQDQLTAIQHVKADMESKRPMDRLLCGDVGYGKTEVALRAAFKAVMDGKQVAVLVPTTVLAQQHYDTFQERLAAYPVQVEMLSRFRKPKEQSDIIKKLSKNQVDIVIGTHRLISSDVAFKDLGLVIIDEEQRFGVTHKEHLKKMRASVDVLTLTATPIPRTLYMALTGARDISNINTPPEERLPIVTHIGPYEPKLVREAIIRELDRGGQIFFVHNRVQTIPAIYHHLSNLVPEAKIGIGHGQMPEDQLAEVMHEFSRGEVDVLLCTSIIESGLDIPNANTLIIDRADTFGLAQLYQLRGRVGRGAQRAYAYLFRDSRRPSTIDGQERLEVLAEHTQLGSGYAIAMRDLEMRGAGELLGTRQSGYIASVGFNLYTKLLAQAIKELRKASGMVVEPVSNVPAAEIPSLPVNVELPISSGLPTDYIPDQALRLNLYRRIANIRDEAELTATAIEFTDRFGELPEQVENLLYQMRVKIRANKIGLASISIENEQMVLRYPPLPNGIKQRNLPEVDDRARPGRNAYWVSLSGLEAGAWKQTLLTVLTKIDQATFS